MKGKILAARIANKELRLSQALMFAAEIADALACAHAAGIILRGLKPSNIMIARDGPAKVLDFGLAKLTPAARTGNEPTETLPSTGEHFIVGTCAYMSPEQVSGRELDHRTDIFSFGLVLHEMLAGSRAFSGESCFEVITSILTAEPAQLPESVATAVREIVLCCLEKNPEARFRSAHDLAVALRVNPPHSSINAVPVTAPPRRWLAPALAAAVLALSVVSVALFVTRPEPLDLSTYKFTPFAMDAERESHGVWSPDEMSIAYLRVVAGQLQVMVRALDAPTPTQLTRLPSGVYGSAPFFSPDGERINYIASGSLWSVAAVGGEPGEVLKAPMLVVALSPDGRTLAFWRRFAQGGKQYGGLWISAPPGAQPTKHEPAPFQVLGGFFPDYLHFSPDGSKIGLSVYREQGTAWMWILPWPDGPGARPRRMFSGATFRAVPPFAWMPDSRNICLSMEGSLWLGDSDTGKLRQLTVSSMTAAAQPAIAPRGKRLLFTADVWDFNLVEFPLDGAPPLPVLVTSRGEGSPSIARTSGQMAFISNRSGDSEIWLRNSGGDWERPVVRQRDFPDGGRSPFQSVALSPDGTRLADRRRTKFWVSPVQGGRPLPAVVGGEWETGGPSWSPDSSSITYISYLQPWRYVTASRIEDRQSTATVPDSGHRGRMCIRAGLVPGWALDRLRRE